MKLRLLRSWAGAGDLAVTVKAPDPKVTGSVAWRRYPTNDAFAALPMVRKGETLRAALPHQPPAGKVEYQVRLEREGQSALFPERPAIARFKGAVSNVVIVPHVFAMFTGMLIANAAGLFALRGERKLFRISLVVVALLTFGGLFLGPLVQKQAFDAYWTGWPFGGDMTDNKTAVAVLAWVDRGVARPRGPRRPRRRRRRGARDARRLHDPAQRLGLADRLVQAPAPEVGEGAGSGRQGSGLSVSGSRSGTRESGSLTASFRAPGWSGSPDSTCEALPTARTTIFSGSRSFFAIFWTSAAVTAFTFSR